MLYLVSSFLTSCIKPSFVTTSEISIHSKSLPLPMENDENRPRIDLVVFIINLTSELSFQSAEASLKYLDPGYFLGKVCFMVTNSVAMVKFLLSIFFVLFFCVCVFVF
uniref:Centromere protein M n=1 Tax=Amphilophus citrinellus TaxID=61819 RepID=A0A3Q0QTV2_AMPCI